MWWYPTHARFMTAWRSIASAKAARCCSCPDRTASNWHRIARRLDYTPRLTEIGIPVLLLCGREDPQFPPACSQELAEKIRHARLIFFRRSGHYPFLEEPEKFWAATTAFLTSACPTPP